MPYRVIRGLRWAKPISRPESIPKGRPRGAKRDGVLYEKQIAKALPAGFIHGQWWQFEDDFGPGFAQTDFVMLGPEAIILEAKLSWKPEAYNQLEFLYRPIVEMVTGGTARTLIITKRLTREMKDLPMPRRQPIVCHDLYIGVERAKPRQEVVVHWLGKNVLSLEAPLRRRVA